MHPDQSPGKSQLCGDHSRQLERPQQGLYWNDSALYRPCQPRQKKCYPGHKGDKSPANWCLPRQGHARPAPGVRHLH